ncbi:MAG: type IV pilin protein [Candidatus Methylomirabilales bacterium]
MSDPLLKPSDAVSNQPPPITAAGADTPVRSTPRRSICRSLSGLTLIEVLIGIGVVTVLVMVAYPSYVGVVVKARETAALAHMSDWPKAQFLYQMDKGHFATSLTQLYDAGFLVPVDAARIGYTFEITEYMAEAPPQDRPTPTFAGAPAQKWWEGIGFVKHAWAKSGQGKDGDKDDDGEAGGDGGGDEGTEPPAEGTGTGSEIGWGGYADPIDERPRHFYTDHTNEVRFAKGRRASRHDPVVVRQDTSKGTGGISDKGTNEAPTNTGSSLPALGDG